MAARRSRCDGWGLKLMVKSYCRPPCPACDAPTDYRVNGEPTLPMTECKVTLYHFTGLRQVLGEDGFDRVRAVCAVDVMPFATPGSILASGLKPHLGADEAAIGICRPCVWLTSDPDMPRGFNRWTGCRVSVEIPAKDRRLCRWTGLFRGETPMQAEADRFYIYWGKIPLRRLVAVESYLQREAPEYMGYAAEAAA